MSTGFGASYRLRESAKTYAASAAFAHVLDGAKALEKQTLTLGIAGDKLADLRQQVLAAEAEYDYEKSETLRLAGVLKYDSGQAADIVGSCFVNKLHDGATQELKAITEAENLRFRKMKDILADITSSCRALSKKRAPEQVTGNSRKIPKDAIVAVPKQNPWAEI